MHTAGMIAGFGVLEGPFDIPLGFDMIMQWLFTLVLRLRSVRDSV